MQHTRFLKHKREGLMMQIAELEDQKALLLLKVGHIDELLADDSPDEWEHSSVGILGRSSTPPMRDVLIRFMRDAPQQEMTLVEMMNKAEIEGIPIQKTTLQSTLSRNKGDFRNVDPRVGKWALVKKPMPHPVKTQNSKEIEAEANIKLEGQLTSPPLPPHIGQAVPNSVNASAPRTISSNRPPEAKPVDASINNDAPRFIPARPPVSEVTKVSVGAPVLLNTDRTTQGMRPAMPKMSQPLYPEEFEDEDPYADE